MNRVFVSSTVYGIEELLERIYSRLTALGFRHVDGRKQAENAMRTVVSPDGARSARRIFDLRSIDLYEEVVQDHAGKDRIPLAERKGNWVQPFALASDGELFAYSQFSRYQEAEAFVDENFGKGEGGGK